MDDTEVQPMKKVCLWVLVMLMGICCAAHAENEAIVLQMGQRGTEILELNTRLRQLNYTAMPATDEYSQATHNAVLAVQKAYGLAETGLADEETLAILYGTCYRPLAQGDSGLDVQLLQEKLMELGYYWGKCSGNFLEGTSSALITFQNEHGMEPTGKADVKTQEMLFAISVRPTPSPTPEAPPATPVPTPGAYMPFTKKLTYGDQSGDVQKLQERLMQLGFFTYHKTTTGYYAKTQDAVKQFQLHNGLDATGNVDEETWNAIFNDFTVADINCTPKPVPPLQYFFEVDINNQVVKVWKYNEETKDYTDLDRAFLCATGTKKYPTPLGTFVLSGRTARWCEFPTWGGGKAQYWTKIDDSIAFHSVLYSDNNSMSLNVSSLTGLGKRGSHGCIRLTVADARWIFEHVKKGMRVWIHEDGERDPELRHAIQPGALNKNNMLPYTTPEPPSYTYDGTKPPAGDVRALNLGKEGADVYWLQMKLKELGFYKGTPTGQYREGTQKAVNAYQRARGLSADGNAGTRTLNALYQEVIEANATPTPPPTPAPTPEPTPLPTPTLAPTASPEPTAMTLPDASGGV